MSVKDLVLQAIQACADAAYANGSVGTATQRGALRFGLGTPGQKFLFRGESRSTGQSYVVPGSLDCIIQGLIDTIGKRLSTSFRNDDTVTIKKGAVARMVGSGNRRVVRASSASVAGLIGVALEDVDVGATRAFAIAGEVDILLKTGETPNEKDLLAPSSTAGESIVTVVEADAFAVVTDTTGFVDPSNRLVKGVLMLRPRI